MVESSAWRSPLNSTGPSRSRQVTRDGPPSILTPFRSAGTASAASGEARAKTSICRVGSATAPSEKTRVLYSASSSTAFGLTLKRTWRGTGPPSRLRMMS
ncbi:hypothetical protein D3C73_1167450 [compost metagenome]